MPTNAEFFLPGGDGKWRSAPVPDTLEAAQARIRVLELALGFYTDARSYNPDSGDNEMPTHDELLKDKGLRARIGRLATDPAQFGRWVDWAVQQHGQF